MKFKLLFSVLATLGFINELSAQSCNLITSITLNTQQTQSIESNALVGYLPNSINIISDTTKWHYIALTKSGTTGSFFFDGILVTSGNFDNNPYIWNSLLLGATQACVSCKPVPNFNGLIDEVRVSNVSRTAQSVASTYSANIPFKSDANTIGLFHLDNLSGNTVINSNGGTATVFGAPTIVDGKYGKAVNFDGLNDYIRWSNSIPVNNMTVEFWFKSSDQDASVAMLEYAYNTGIYLANKKVTNPIKWSTGDTTSSITVTPSKLPYVWVSNGICYDTIFFDSKSSTIYDTITVKNNVYDTVTITNKVTQYDTVIVKNTIYDTILKLKFKLTTGLQANKMASISLYPNPTSDVLHIEVGDAKALDGYRYRIVDALGKEVYNELVKSAITGIPMKTLGAAGMYQFEVLDQKNVRTQTNKIVLQ